MVLVLVVSGSGGPLAASRIEARVGGRSFTPVTTDKFVVAQSAKLPETELLKGVKDTGPRTGGITHILYEEE